MTNKLNFLVAALNRGLVFPAPAGRRRADGGLISRAAAAELFYAGYNIHPDTLELFSKDQLTDLVTAARTASYADRDWAAPMYPNFPRSVRETDELVLLIDQLVHYMSGGVLVPAEIPEYRGELPFEDTVVANKTLTAQPASEVPAIVSQLVCSKTAMSDNDAAFIESAAKMSFSVRQELFNALLDTRHDENMHRGLLIALRVADASDDIYSRARELMNSRTNANGLLRVILALYTSASTGKDEDYNTACMTLRDSMAYAVRVNSIPAAVRRTIVRRLGAVTQGKFGCDMLVSNQNLWRKVCKSIHSFNYVESEESRFALDVIHHNVKYHTLNSMVDWAISKGLIMEASDALAKHRPAGFLRQLSRLAQVATPTDVCMMCKDIEAIAAADRAPVSAFISAYQGIVNYNQDFKVLRVAGALNHAAENTRSLPRMTVDHLSEALLKSISMRLNGVELPQRIGRIADDAPVELMRRDASTTDRDMTRGERVRIDDLGKGTTLRLFTQWHGGGVDLDLAVGLLDESYSMVEMCSWNGGKVSPTMTHSGDLTSAPRGATEYVDLKINKTQARYAVVTIDAYSGDALSTVNAVAGVSVRSQDQAGELFDPRTVKLSFKITTGATDSLPFIVDLQTREFIWMDSSFGRSSFGGSMKLYQAEIAQMVHSTLTRKSVTYGDIVKMLVMDHGVQFDKTQVTTRKDVHAILAQAGL